MEEADLASLVGGILILLLIGVFSGFETALAGSNRSRIKQLAGENSPRRRTFDFLLFEQARVISLIGLWKIILVVLLTGLTVYSFSVKIETSSRILLYSVLLVILLTLLVSFTFRHFALRRSEIYLLSLYPLTSFIARSLRLWNRFFSKEVKTDGLAGKFDESDFSTALSEENIRMMVTAGQEHGILEEDESEMIHSIFEFGDTIAREIMIPRVDIVSVEANTPITRALDVYLKNGFSRLPVYEDNIDNIIGIANLKDLVNVLHENRDDLSLMDLARPAYFVPGNKKIDELLREMQATKHQMVIVVDEYGGTDGLITTEDIVEEIVGEILDEYDREVPPVIRMPDGTWMVDAGTVIEDVNDELGTTIPTGDEYETIGGYVYGLLGHVPEEKEYIESNGLKITVEKIQRHRIKRLKLEKLPQEIIVEKEPGNNN
ncbi:MAG: HlyC/CorC family transporter [Candidatus Eremiobacteraeota bacterium]|nr:HlyC/CorC family transporter [Candidatus Eremiobacteraeota bacterium]